MIMTDNDRRNDRVGMVTGSALRAHKTKIIRSLNFKRSQMS